MFKRLLLLSSLFVSVAFGQVAPNRYIVELSTEPVAHHMQAGKLSAEGIRQRRAIAAQQTDVVREVENRGMRIRAAVDTVMNALIVETPGMDARAEMAQLRALPGVLRVYPERTYQATMDRATVIHRVPQAWALINGSEKAGLGIKVGILDSGIDASHPAFQDASMTTPDGFPKVSKEDNKKYVSGKVIVARSYEDISSAAYGTDASAINNHGTNAAMASAAVVHNGPPGSISGVAPKAFLGNYKVLGDNGSGGNAAIIKAVDDSVQDGMDIINLSLGSPAPQDPSEDPLVIALEKASAAGLIVIVSAGNSGPDPYTMLSPGTAPSAITVGASRNDRQVATGEPLDPTKMADFSSRGPNIGPGLKPDMVAVGTQLILANSTLNGGDPYRVTQGTSFAAPIVAGAAALLKGAKPGLSVAQYRSLLINSTRPLAPDAAVPIRDAGAGILDMEAAVRSTVASTPTSLKFGISGRAAKEELELTIANLGTEADLFSLAAVSQDKVKLPVFSESSVDLAAGKSVVVKVSLDAKSLTAGDYQGVISVKGTKGQPDVRIPYWFVVPGEPSSISMGKPLRGAENTGTVSFATVDAAGLPVKAPTTVTPVSGDGSLVALQDFGDQYPGEYIARLQLTPDETVFQITAGNATRTVTFPPAGNQGLEDVE